MTLVERFLKYVSFDTQSSEETGVILQYSGTNGVRPVSERRIGNFGSGRNHVGRKWLSVRHSSCQYRQAVARDRLYCPHGYKPRYSGKNVSPRIVQNYDGKDIVLCAEENVVLSPARFPELLDHQGEDLIVTDGKTLLGADDKARYCRNCIGGGISEGAPRNQAR